MHLDGLILGRFIMGKIKAQAITLEENFVQMAEEIWEHEVMTEVRDYINVHGADVFKDALMMFNRETYDKLFHPKKESETCYLTEKHDADTSRRQGS